MKPLNYTERQGQIKAFSFLVFLGAFVFFLLLSSLIHKDNRLLAMEKKISNSPELQEKKIHEDNTTLHSLLARLQQLDKQYAFLLMNSGDGKKLDSLNIVIHQEDEYFSATIDRIGQDGFEITDVGKRKQFESMMIFFKSIISDREAITTLRNAVSLKTNSLDVDKEETDLNDELMEEKDNTKVQEGLVSVANP